MLRDNAAQQLLRDRDLRLKTFAQATLTVNLTNYDGDAHLARLHQ